MAKRKKQTNISENNKNTEEEEKESIQKKKILSFFKSTRTKYAILIILIIAFVASIIYTYRDEVIVAFVNNEPITRLEVVKELEAQSGSQAVDALITKTLVQQRAQEQGVEITREELVAELRNFKSQIEGSGQDFNQFLEFQGLTLNQLQEEFRFRLLLEELLAEQVEVTEEEVTEYIEQNEAQLGGNVSSEEIRQQVREQLENQKLSQEAQSFIQTLREEADIIMWKNY